MAKVREFNPTLRQVVTIFAGGKLPMSSEEK